MSHSHRLIGIGAFLALSCVSISAFAARGGCESWQSASIASIADYGQKIVLDDGSIWRIDARGIAATVRWRPHANIEICNDHKLTNTDEAESVRAREIQ